MKKMRRFIIASLCFTLLVLSGCTSDQKPNNTENPEKPKEPEATSWLREPSEKFDSAPIALYEKGFLVEKDDLYGFVDEKGSQLLDYKYKLMDCFVEDAYGIENLDQMTYLSELLEVEGYNSGCWTGVVGAPIYIWYSTKQKAIMETAYNYDTQAFETIEAKELSQYMQNPTTTSFFLPVDVTLEELDDDPENKGYIFMTTAKTAVDDSTIYDDIELKDAIYNPKNTFAGLALVKQKGKWAVMDDQGTLLSDFIYDEGDVFNKEYVKLEKGNTITLLRKDKKEYTFEDIEDITAPIHGVVYAKQNDVWGTIQLQED